MDSISIRDWLRHLYLSPFCDRTYVIIATTDGQMACPCGWSRRGRGITDVEISQWIDSDKSLYRLKMMCGRGEYLDEKEEAHTRRHVCRTAYLGVYCVLRLGWHPVREAYGN
jgi:hypothetical protein